MLMQRSIFWRGLAYHSLEKCNLSFSHNAIEAASIIRGTHQTKEFAIVYVLKLTVNWEVISCRMERLVGAASDVRTFRHDGHGNWTINQIPSEEFKGCVDMDISATPFTNSLPVNRLKLKQKEAQSINVLYIDVFEGITRRAVQRYTRMTEYEYLFQDVPTDFRAVVTVDSSGIVTDYPGLFVHAAV